MDATTAAEPLPRRRFGRTDLRVPPIAIGCAPLGNMPEAFGYEVDDEQARSFLRAAFAGPIPYIDTAAWYGDGESERRIGLVLKETGGLPSGCVLQTKAGREPETNDYSGEMVKRRFERSLRLLGLDAVDIVYLHDAEWTSFEAAMAPGGPVEILRSYQQQGVIRFLGVAAGPVDVELRYVATGLFDALITHNRYTLLNRTADPLIQAAADRGMAVLNAAPYASGVLAKGPASGARYVYQDVPPDVAARIRRLDAICAQHNVPLAAAALQFSLRDPRIAATIVGMAKPERLQHTVALAQHPIPDALWPELEALPTDQTDPEADRWG